MFTKRPVISKFRGDSIGECRIIQSLSRHFDVYYNGKLVTDGDQEFGQGDKVEIPKSGYDLYYVRANAELFKQLPHPKICMAYPYDEEAFDCADGLVVTTEIWRKGLLDRSLREKYHHFFDKWYPKELEIRHKVVKFKQMCDPFISPSNIDQSAVDNWRASLVREAPKDALAKIRQRVRSLFGHGKGADESGPTTLFGFYGRLDADNIPYTIIDAFRRHDDRALVVFAGRIRKELQEKGGLPAASKYLGELSYDQMPSLIRATTYTMADETPDAYVLGSNKVLDSISMGVPVLSMRNLVREEYLGADYPLLFKDKSEIDDAVSKLLNDNQFRQLVAEKTSAAAKKNNIEVASLKTRNELEVMFS